MEFCDKNIAFIKPSHSPHICTAWRRTWELLQGVAVCCAAVDACVIVYVHGWHPKVRLLPAQEFGLALFLLGNTSVLVLWGDC